MSSTMPTLSLEFQGDMWRLAVPVAEGRPEVKLSDSLELQRSLAECAKHVVQPNPRKVQPLKRCEVFVDMPCENSTDMGYMEADTTASESETDSKCASDSGAESRVGEQCDANDEASKANADEEDAVVADQSLPSAFEEFMPAHVFPSRWLISSCASKRRAERTEQNTDLEWTKNKDVLTLMMKNIPCGCKRDDILAAVEEVGYAHLYDFFYAPTRRDKCLGYAFISFPLPELAQEFARAMTGYRFKRFSSDKKVTIAPATTQGLRDNMKHFRATAVMHTKAKPLFKGRRSFDLHPEPTTDERNCGVAFVGYN